jgi:hypothetical protein
VGDADSVIVGEQKVEDEGHPPAKLVANKELEVICCKPSRIGTEAPRRLIENLTCRLSCQEYTTRPVRPVKATPVLFRARLTLCPRFCFLMIPFEHLQCGVCTQIPNSRQSLRAGRSVLAQSAPNRHLSITHLRIIDIKFLGWSRPRQGHWEILAA